jgi:iron(III) transport system permease protein
MSVVDDVRQAVRGEQGLSTTLTLASGAVAAGVLFPILWLVLRGVSIGPQTAVSLLFGPRMAEVLFNSVVLVVLVTAASAAVGVTFAVLTVQTDLPFRRFWTVVAALPLVVPSYIGAFTFSIAFSSRGGLTDALAAVGLGNTPPIYGLDGTVLVMTLFTYPYVFLTTRAALVSFDTSLVEAARSLNHTRLQAFRKVTLPQVLPGIAAGSLLVALYTLSDFGTPAIMHFDVFTRMIYVNAYDRNFAALLSLQLLVVTLVIITIENSIEAGDESGYVSTRARTGTTFHLGWWTLPALLFCAAVAFLALVLPVLILFSWMLRPQPGYGGFEFQWSYMLNSVGTATGAAIAATLLALPVAYLSGRGGGRLARVFERGTYVGYAAPGIVIGFALVYFGQSYAPFLYQTLPLLLFAYVVRFIPQAVGAVRSSVLQVDPKLSEAARTLGHTRVEVFRKVTLPLIVPGIVSGAALVFLTTMKELPATLLLRPTEFETLTTYIWRVREAAYYGDAAIPALVLVAVSGVSMLILLRGGTDGT